MSNASLDLEIGPARPSELNFVLKAWKKSFGDSPKNAVLPKNVYYDRANPEINALVQRCRVLVARDAADPSFAYGFAAYETRGDALCVHFIYVKKDFRRLGVASALFADLLEKDGNVSEALYTHSTRFDDKAHELGLKKINLHAWARR